MATDTDHHRRHHHHSYCNNWPNPNCLPSDAQHPQQEISIPELIDHGSISFGRFAAESLAWEKWSVFSHNRCQEELEKFKAPGLVAQKKAYFEEYYQKIRAMKKLRAEQQETNLSDPCQEEQSSTKQADNSDEITKAKEEKKPNDVDQIKISETGTITDQDSLGEISMDKSAVAEQQGNNLDDNVNMGNESNICSSTIEPEHFANKAAPKPAPSVKRCSKTAQQYNLFPNTVKPSANKPKDYAPPSKNKGNGASARNKTKLDCRTKKDVIKPAEKPMSSLDRDITGKTGNSLVSSKRTTPKVASNIESNMVPSHRSFTGAHSSLTVLHRSVLKDKLAASSSSIRGGLTRANSNSKGLVKKSTSKEITVTGSVRNMDLAKRTCAGVAGKSIELSSQHMIPKRGQSENQKPKSMSRSLPAQNKSNQNFGNEFGRRNFVGGKQKEVTNAAGLGRVSKPASSMPLGTHKASNLKLEHKVVPWQSADLTHARSDPRHKMPGWR
uniref:TPX2 C-terminal domain-containing protein n=1 Tax=Davidia involucrata TaxID=16924 RepID=A0A5B7AL22_DAVIN